jgi:hypothetical protein
MSGQARSIGGLLAGLGIAWSWFSQLTSIVGLVGIVEDLKIWFEAWDWCLARLRETAPGLEPFLVGLGASIHQGLEFFRGLYRPAMEFVFGWLPFDPPHVLMDVVVVAIFVVGSHWRADAANMKRWSKVTAKDDSELLAAAASFGIVVAQRSDVWRLERAVHGYQHGKHIGQEAPYAIEDLAWALAQWGEAFEKLAQARPLFLDIGDAKRGLLAGQRRLMFFIYGFAALVALLLVAEWLWFR